MKFICRWIFHLKGWKLNRELPPEIRRCVLIAAPHTSNWDFFFGVGGFDILKIPFKFALKKEWFFFPFSIFLKSMGAVAIDRSPKNPGEERISMVDAMAKLFEGKEDFAIMVAPEGTRKLRETWKTGFYHVAKKAGVPICFGYLDYEKKEAGIGKALYPSDDMKADMKQIMEFYKNIKPKNPENFSLDKNYI